MDIKTKYGWQELYATALLETDWTKIEQKIQATQNVIGARLHEFSLNHGGTPEENKQLWMLCTDSTVCGKMWLRGK